jgi:flagellar biosynthetic protein FliQ
MSQETALEMCRQCLWVVVELAGPLVGAGMAVGMAASIVQAATQVQEQSLSFVPKVGALMAVLLVMGSWMLTKLVDLTHVLLTSLPTLAR